MFGYDWEVDREGNSVEFGEGKSMREISQSVISSCNYTDCTHERDAVSTETQASYVDAEGKKHMVWFEDEESVKKKREYLQKMGISSYSYWAYSYY